MGQFEEADVPKRGMIGDELRSTVDEGAPPASAQAPHVRATEDYDFISNKGVAAADATTLNPRLSGNPDENTLSNVSTVRNVILHVYILLSICFAH